MHPRLKGSHWQQAKSPFYGHFVAGTAAPRIYLAPFNALGANRSLRDELHYIGRGGGTGRRAGFKIRFSKGSAGSIPAPGTTTTNGFRPFSVFSNLRNTARFPSAHRTRSFRASVGQVSSSYFVRSRHSAIRYRRSQTERLLFPKADVKTGRK